MGCATSRLDASDVILQCKERRKVIKEAVNYRQDFAIAHVAYIQTLRNVGIALRRFSEGEVSETSPKSPSTPVLRLQEVSHVSTPIATLSPPRALSSTSSCSCSSSPPSSPGSHSVPSAVTPTPMKAASPVSPPAVPASASPPASSRASHFSQSSPPPLTQASSPRKSVAEAPPPPYSVNGMGSPDRGSDYSPPFYSPRRDDADDYFMAFSPSQHIIRSPPPMPSPSQNTSSWFMYDIFDAPPIPYNLLEQRRRKQGGGVELEDDEEEVTSGPAPAPAPAPVPAPDNEVVRKEEEIPDLEDVEAKDDEEVRSVKSVEKLKPVEEKPAGQGERTDASEKPAPPETTSEGPMEKPNGKIVEPIVMSPSPEKEVVVEVEPKVSPKRELSVVTSGQGRDLTGAVKHIHMHFARAYRSGKDVSSLLETQMVYHHLGFVDAKDNTKVFNAITMHWLRKSSLAMRDAYDENDMAECGMFGSHASTLERLYAWEKKLYDEVKAGEVIRIAFDRKCQQLHNLDAKGGDPVAIDKTRAALKKLDTRLIVALRAIHLASMRIQKLTIEELYPQLAELLGGLMSMWKVMLECHKAQAAIAAEMQTIENSIAANEASEAHLKATSQLEYELEKWQDHFQRWISAQKNYIRTLHAWLSNCHLEPERDSKGRAVSPHWSGKPAIFHLLSNWKDALLKLEEPQRAVNAISKFSSEVHSLEQEQAGELDLKKSAERSARDLDYSTRSLKKLEGRYIDYKEEANGDIASKKSSMESRRADVDSRRSIVESEKQRHTEVMLDRKEKTLSRFRQHLPLVFESMASFAKEAVKTYERLHPEKSPVRENGVAHHHSEEED